MELKFKPIGNKRISRARAKYPTPMATISKASTRCPKSMVKECTFGLLITLSMKVNSEKMLCRGRPVFISPLNNTIPVV